MDENQTVRAAPNLSFKSANSLTPATKNGCPTAHTQTATEYAQHHTCNPNTQATPHTAHPNTPATVPRANSLQYKGATQFILDKLTKFALNQHTETINKRLDAERTANELRYQQLQEVITNHIDPIATRIVPEFF